MKFKQVYLYDGTPFLAFENEDGEYNYPNDEWTETPPPEGIYSPFYFNGNEWVGATREEWLKENEDIEVYEPTKIEKQLALAQLQLTKTANQLIQSRNEQGKLMLEVSKKEQRLKKLEESHAQLALELTKQKGGE